MEGKRLIKTIRLQNLLSYGSKGEEIELKPLNVLIGRNASGKSNLIEGIGLLRAASTDFAAPIRHGGGIGEWLWKGKVEFRETEIETIIEYPDGAMPLRYKISFGMVGQILEIIGEYIGCSTSHQDHWIDSFFYRSSSPSWIVSPRQGVEQKTGTSKGRSERILASAEFSQQQSILSQLRDPFQYPEITFLGGAFAAMRLFRELDLGPEAPARLPQKTDLPGDFLLEDTSNLALVLSDFQHKLRPMQRVLKRLKEFYEAADDISTKIEGGTVQIFLHEKGLMQPIPASRLSDGMLRYLCLLVILCHPTPPPLVCIEEPEIGLHPDVLPTIAELLIEASQRTQLVITTHSDALVSALSDTPEAVLVCERDSEGTSLHRLEREALKEWLEKYSLGELWRMGEIGGT
jgi:predicted ATPase